MCIGFIILGMGYVVLIGWMLVGGFFLLCLLFEFEVFEVMLIMLEEFCVFGVCLFEVGESVEVLVLLLVFVVEWFVVFEVDVFELILMVFDLVLDVF